MKFSTFLKIALVGVLFLIVAGVVAFVFLFNSSREIQKDSEASANRYYQTLFAKDRDWDKIESMYAPEFFGRTAMKEWREMLENLEKKFGKYQSHRLQGFHFRKHFGTGGSQQIAVLTYDVRYANGNATEMITLISRGKNPNPKVLGHQINSPMLLKPDK